MQVLILVEKPETKEEEKFVMVEAQKEEDVIDCNMLGLGEEEDSEMTLQVMRRVNESHTLKISGSSRVKKSRKDGQARFSRTK